MAENGQSTTPGRPPFRRYIPSAEGAATDQAMPLPSLGLSSSPDPEESRNNRAERSRWRQWVKQDPLPPVEPAAPEKPVSRIQYQPPGRSGPSGKAAVSLSSVPLRSPAPKQPPAAVEGRPTAASQPTAQSPQRSGQPPSGEPSPNNRDGVSRSKANNKNKVTPLRRRQPTWSSPAAVSPEALAGRRDRKPPRRPSRKTPQPILYGIRLLILGTGVAAIAGTTLSSLHPSSEATVSEASASLSGANGSRRSGQPNAALTDPLPLAEELVALETDLMALEAMTPGLVQSTFLYDLDTGNYLDVNGVQPVSAASTIKLPILVALLEAVDAGKVDLQQPVTLREDLVAGGSGDMQTYEVGTQYSVLEVATEMIVNSDNTATNMVIDVMGGMSVLNERFQAWGLEATTLKNLLPDLEGTNTTSPADLVRVLALVDQGEILGLRSRDRFFAILNRTYNTSLIPEGLGDSQAITYNKTGDIGTSLGDIALVDAPNGKRYILGVLVKRPHNDGRANELIRRIAGRVHEEMNLPLSPIGGTTPPPTAEPSSETAPNGSTPPLAAPLAPTDNQPPPNAEPLPEATDPQG